MSSGFEEDLATRGAATDAEGRLRLAGAEVEIVAGPDAGQKLPLGAGGLVVGSGVGADLRLGDKLVSRRHLELRAEADGVRVVDRGSRNGTYLGGARVTELVLLETATLALGDTRLVVRLLGQALELPLSPRTRFGEAIAKSSALRHVFELLERAAKTGVTVLLEGESGTGKDVLAHAVHQESARKEGPFVVVDCGAIPENLVESELFGHEKGAFTGASSTREGAFEQANGGTVFLDEVGELPLEAQPKLLRALESRSFRRVGGAQTIKVDVRVVAATNRRLREAVRRREFREDLYYRLAVVHVTVPPLVDRREDIAPLAESFLRRATGNVEAKIPEDLARLLLAYDWPGNARELRNVVERFATFERADANLLFGEGGARAEPVGDETLLRVAGLDGATYHDGKRRLVEAFHRVVLPRAVERAGGSVQAAAERLGIPRASLYRMLQQLRGGEDPDP